ncbi:MAG: potassium transporter [Elusimicrobia bacterium RIFOXYA2_FULL_58_8]|nr:MAG: potassium transporter [Elusimicrobia bacterium RIFOXYA12_FULL_57_11]OGS15667.1 MAG: potassium transporter [Elusimicrobia bacterium RIFOXYA2_FULL_58_8]
MQTDAIPLITGLLILTASLLSLKLGLSVAIFEILLGLAAGGLGLRPAEWMVYIAGFGGILLTFLAGAEVDGKLLRDNLRQAGLISFFSFFAPLAAGYILLRYVAHWSAAAAALGGIALSETSVAVVYSVLAETGRQGSKTGKLLMACTFLTNTLTALALSAAFLKPNFYTFVFLAVSGGFLAAAWRFSGSILRHPRLAGKVIEPEIKYIFFVLLAFIYLAELGASQAMLPAFIFGLLMSGHFRAGCAAAPVKNRLRTVAYAFITPMFFIVTGMKVSLAALWDAAGLFAALFAARQAAKAAGVYFFAKKFFPAAGGHFTLLMSTGLTFGLMAALFGLKEGVLDTRQYSVLTCVLIASAVLPAFAAQRWFAPAAEEDLP